MRRGSIRTLTVGLATLGLAVVGAPAVADPPSVYHDDYTAIECQGPVGERKLVVAGYFDANDQSTGGDADFHDGQTLIWGNVEEDSTWDGTAFALHATFVYGQPQDEEATAAAGEPGTSAGEMTVTGTASPVGDPLVVDNRWKQGNQLVRESGTVVLLQGVATVTSASGDVAVALGAQLACTGHVVDITTRATNPASFVSRSSWYDATCELPGEAPTAMLAVSGSGRQAWGFLGLGIVEGDDEEEWSADLVASGELTRTGRTIDGNLLVEIPEAQAGEAVAVELRVGDLLDRTRFREHSPKSTINELVAYRSLEGRLTLPGGRAVTVADCVLAEIRTFYRSTENAGQKPGGKPPVNDLPAAALPLADGQTAQQSTRGAAVAPEAPCLVTDPEGGSWEVPLGRTIWYTFQGTGGAVTLSTEGTGFDTVIGVYLAGDGPGQQVACVDDVVEGDYSLQARVTVPTEAAVTYLVQVGGFGYDEPDGPAWGTMVSSRS